MKTGHKHENKTMIFNLNHTKKNYNQAKLQNVAIENVRTFPYLGDELKFDEPRESIFVYVWPVQVLQIDKKKKDKF